MGEVMEQKQPNIVFIMTDQMRGDCMGIAGHPDVKTPFLDTLAARGTLFDRAYSIPDKYRAVLLRERPSIQGFRRKNTAGLGIRTG